MKKAIITSNLNTVYVRRGEEKEVDLTKQVQAAIDGGYVLDITPKPTRKKAEKVESSNDS